MKRMYLFYNQSNSIVAQVVQQSKNLQIVPPAQSNSIDEELIVAQAVQQIGGDEIPDLIVSIPWGHHTTILRKIKDLNEAIFYVSKQLKIIGAVQFWNIRSKRTCIIGRVKQLQILKAQLIIASIRC